MRISIITLFPQMFAPLQSSIVGRAQTKGLLELELINLRDFGEGVHQVVDGRPYSGGAGMILRADILAKSLKSIRLKKSDKSLVILTSAAGKRYSQKGARSLSEYDHLVIICGHYEGVDQRFIEKYVDLELSIGDFVLTGGEIPAMVIVDSVTRLIKGVLKKEEATLQESFEDGLLEYPHYTRPEVFDGLRVPEILTSGNHQEIEKWRKEESLKKTQKTRPDLLN